MERRGAKPVIQEPEPWGQATRQIQLPFKITAENGSRAQENGGSGGGGRGGAVSAEKGETNRANVLGEEGAADGQGPAAVPQGRRATVSAGVELARFRTGQQTAARNQTRATHSQRLVGGGGGAEKREREREREKGRESGGQRERDKEQGRKREIEKGRERKREMGESERKSKSETGLARAGNKQAQRAG